MQVGDVAVPSRQSVAEGRFLHCGSGRYSHAIVGSVNPFVLVSSQGDMVWSCTWKPEQMEFLCQASADVIATVRKRLESTKEHICQHIIIEDEFGSAVCEKCKEDFGWFCPIAGDSICEYSGDEWCIHCGEPEERK